MKKTLIKKLCWFCEKKCYDFVSICPECVVNKRKKNTTYDKKNPTDKKVIL